MSYDSKPWKHLYKTKTWRHGRLVHLMENPLCERCGREGRLTLATVVHHVKAHRGDWELFSDPGNWESSCETCHNRIEQSIEARGFDKSVNASGWPSDKQHRLYGGQSTARLPSHMPHAKCRCVVVWGAPGAGKSTLIRWMASPADVIADIDRTECITDALTTRNALVAAARPEQLCWITTAAARQRDRDAWTKACCGNVTFIQVKADRKTCYRRRPQHRKEIDAWFVAAD